MRSKTNGELDQVDEHYSQNLYMNIISGHFREDELDLYVIGDVDIKMLKDFATIFNLKNRTPKTISPSTDQQQV